MFLENEILHYWENVFIGIGSNLGNAKEKCKQGIIALDKKKEIDIIQCSPFYKTEPLGGPEQGWFINCVVEIKTLLSPENLLSYLKNLEIQMGRTKSIRWGPRTIDFDILFLNDKVIDMPDLKIPHPLSHKRLFVLEPMGEIAPDLIHPVFNKSIRDLKKEMSFANQKIEIYKE